MWTAESMRNETVESMRKMIVDGREEMDDNEVVIHIRTSKINLQPEQRNV